MKLRDLKIVESWYHPNDGTRPLLESILVPEVAKALRDWQKAGVDNCVLVGGLAVGFHAKPRSTADGDFLFISADTIPDTVVGFKKTRAHAFQHNETHVELEVLDPQFLNIDPLLAKKIVDTAITSDGLKVASKDGLIASKLKRFNRQDQADIEELMKLGGRLDDSWPLTPEMRSKYESILKDI
jgi:hypothetical protein